MKIKGLFFNIKILFKKRVIFGFKNLRIATNHMAYSHMWLVVTVLDTVDLDHNYTVVNLH